MSETIFAEIGMVIILATVVAIIARILRQPLIPSYILAGVLLGPVLGVVKNLDIIYTVSEIGVVFLLFIVGLEFDFSKIRNVGAVSVIGGAIQILVLFLIGFWFATFLGFSSTQAMYLGMLVAFSSTMVVVKLLSDKKELETLHGRMVLARLLLEDFFAIVALSILAMVNGSALVENTPMFFVKGALFIIFLVLGSYVLLPRLFKIVAHSGEVLFLSAIAVCFLFSLVFSGIGLNPTIGAFIAGVLLGNLPYNVEIIGRIKPLRDFFATLFFASLGMMLTFEFSSSLLIIFGVFFLITIIIKPFLFILVSAVFGYRKHPAFMGGLALSQTSEFGLIIMAQGIAFGLVANNLLSLAILLTIFSSIVTSYFLDYDEKIFALIAKPLSGIDRLAKQDHLTFLPEDSKQDIVLIGYSRVGYGIFKKLQESKQSFLVVDFNPEVVKQLITEKIPCMYGDIGDLEIIERLGFKDRRMVISTVYDERTNKLLIHKARQENPKITLFVTAYHVEEALALYEAGADYVILPHFLGGDQVSLILEDLGSDVTQLLKRKVEHIEELYHHRRHGHSPPLHRHPAH